MYRVGMNTKSKLLSVKRDLYDFIEKVSEVREKLSDLADEMDKIFKGLKISKIVGAATSIGGTALAVTGFALSFFTFGISLGLTVVGGVIGGAGGVTIAIAQIVDLVHSTKICKEAERALKEYELLRTKVLQDCEDFEDHIQTFGDVDRNFQGWFSFMGKLAWGVGGAGKSIGWNMVGNSIRTGIQIARGVSEGGAEAGVRAFQVAGRTSVHVAGGLVGILLMPLDIYTLVDSAIDLHKDSPHKVAAGIRKVIKELEKDCLTKAKAEEYFKDLEVHFYVNEY